MSYIEQICIENFSEKCEPIKQKIIEKIKKSTS